ncbi:hypothetical protein WwAna1096 [Wolbachia endosymbiont of Drosophila ananassae]|nr:hypothetical protein WwAna1096 [Wolbachia endosymbiont of Drosophila ananassae]
MTEKSLESQFGKLAVKKKQNQKWSKCNQVRR